MRGEDAFDDCVIDDALIWYCMREVLSPDPDTYPSGSHGARDKRCAQQQHVITTARHQ